MINHNDWETTVRKQLFVNAAMNDPAVEVDMEFLRDCVTNNVIRDQDWFCNIFHQVPRRLIREASSTKKVLEIILGCAELMAQQRREQMFRQEVSATNRIRHDFGQRRRGGAAL